MSQLDIWNQDCVTGMAERMGPESADLIVTSIPFSNLFMYSGKLEDVGNSWDGADSRDSHFGLHMRFVVQQMYDVLRPGCIAAIHVQQLLTTKVQHGHMGRRDFRGAVVDLFAAGGFQWTGEVGIPKNPQAMAQRQKLHSLLFVTGMRDGRALAPAVNDYVLIFRKPGDGAPVRCLYDPAKNPDGWLTKDEWIRDASGIWTDIRETDTLEGWRTAGDEDDEKHVCPLQLEVIRRLVRLYTNPGDVVLDPFMGIGSTAYVALEQGRRARGFELKESYHRQALKNAMKAVEQARAESESMPDLFSLLEEAVQMPAKRAPAGRTATKRQRPAYWPDGVDSELEMALLTRLERAGLPLGEGQVRIVPGRQFVWDRAWCNQRVAVEIQGGIWINGAHSRGSGVERDSVKQSMAAALGWRVLPITRAMIESGQAVELIAQALGLEVTA